MTSNTSLPAKTMNVHIAGTMVKLSFANSLPEHRVEEIIETLAGLANIKSPQTGISHA